LKRKPREKGRKAASSKRDCPPDHLYGKELAASGKTHTLRKKLHVTGPQTNETKTAPEGRRQDCGFLHQPETLAAALFSKKGESGKTPMKPSTGRGKKRIGTRRKGPFS